MNWQGLSAVAETIWPPTTESPQAVEKDHAIAMARRVLKMGSCGCSEGDVKVLARQLLRALALSE